MEPLEKLTIKTDQDQKTAEAFIKLVKVMAALRDPENGCPWDLQQSFKTIVPYTIEEAYEVYDAIERGNMEDLKEELGDLLLQPIYHAQMACQDDIFDVHDVIMGITEKMIDRHPHVFGDDRAQSADDVDKIWDQKKSQEKNHDSALDGVAMALPALMRAQKLQKRAAKTGFEWTDIEPVLNKLEEEIQELRESLQNKDPKNQAEELGDVMFVLANLARVLNIDAEEALRMCNTKFTRRFHAIEKHFKEKGQDIKSTSVDEMQDVWNQQKSKE